MARLGFAPVAIPTYSVTVTAASGAGSFFASVGAAALAIGPVGWIALGVATVLPFLHFGSPRGEFQKFDREIYPTLASLSKYTSLDTVTGWFNELVGVDADGQRKVYGSWLGQGPEWGDKAAGKIMELATENFLWSYQPGRSDGPWVLIGPHPVLGSVVYNVLVSIQAAIDYWDAERERMLKQWESSEPAPPPPEPTMEPIDPGEVSAPPSDNPATGTANIDPPAPPPISPLPRPRKRGLWEMLGGILAGVLGPGGILGGGAGRRAPGYPGPDGGRYPGGPGGAPGSTFGIDNDYLYLAAAGLLLLAATQKRKRHGQKKTG